MCARRSGLGTWEGGRGTSVFPISRRRARARTPCGHVPSISASFGGDALLVQARGHGHPLVSVRVCLDWE